MAKNKKTSSLHFAWAKEFTPQRHKFLDGTWHAFFAPGQTPDVIGTSYQIPTDWNRANTVMRPPQVVWLECRIHLSDLITSNSSLVNSTDAMISAFGTTNQLWTADRETVVYDPPFPPSPPWPPFVEPPTPTEEIQTNLAMTEKDRLMAVFNAVKATIEARRPGRTWVQVINWFDGSVTGEAGTVDGGFALEDVTPTSDTLTPILVVPFDISTVEYKSRFTTPSNSWNECLASFLESPDSSFPPYFGTDFLSIYCGNVFTGGITDPANLYLSDAYTPTSFIDSPFFENIYNAYKSASDSFFGLSSRLFHPDLAWSTWTVDTDVPTYTDQHISDWVTTDLGAMLGNWTHSLNYTSMPFTSSGAAHANALCEDNVAFTGEVFDLASEQAATDRLDVTHPGGTSMITEDYLTKLIASHYGFDPDTGQDFG